MIIPTYKKIKSVNARKQTINEEIVYKYILNHPKCSYREVINETGLTEAYVSKSICWLRYRKSIRVDYLIKERKNVYTINTKSTLKTKPRASRMWVRYIRSRLMCEMPNCKNKAFVYDRGADKWLCNKHSSMVADNSLELS